MFERLIEMIESHATYGPALQRAVENRLSLVLDYHTHTGADSYCVSICMKMGEPVPFFEDAGSHLEELVHVREFGQEEKDCLRLIGQLGLELRDHYQLFEPPELYLNGKPLQPD